MEKIRTNFKFPTHVDKTPTGKIVAKAEYGEKGYFDNIEYELNVVRKNGIVYIQYYGEDDTYLTDEEIKQVMLLR